MSPAHMFGSHQALMTLTEEGSSSGVGKIPFHHATLPLDASTASLRELYAAAAQLATPAPTETSATFNEDSARTGDTLGRCSEVDRRRWLPGLAVRHPL